MSAYTALLQRQQVKAQVWPILSFGSSSRIENGDGSDGGDDGGAAARKGAEFKFELRNQGVGPAMMRGAEITFDGKPIRKWADALELVALPKPERDQTWNAQISTMHSRVLAAGESVIPFEPYGDQPARAFIGSVERFGVTLCYCSVLDDCWTLHGDAGEPDAQPVPVRSCPKFPVPFEQ